MFHILALTLLVVHSATVSGASNELGSPAERMEKIQATLDAVKVPASLRTRRLLIASHGEEHANAQETFEHVVDERQYHLHYSKQIKTLMWLGFEKHELPATVDNLLVPDYHEADKRMMMKLWDLEQAWKKAKALDDDKLEAARRLKGNDADTASKEDTTAAASEVPPTAAGPRYLREISEGVHEVAIDGGGSASVNGRHLNPIAGLGASLGKCTEKANGLVYDTTGSLTYGMLASGTACTCKTPILAPATIKEVKFPSRFCECNEKAGTYAFTEYVCDKYPGLAPGSKCTIDTTAFPKVIRCDYIVVVGAVSPKFSAATTISAEFKVGYGASGQKTDLVAELSAGIFTSQMPSPCPIIPMKLSIPNIAGFMFGSSAVNAAMAMCNALKYIADKAAENEPSMDMGQTMFGKAGEGTISLFPFQFKYPKDYIDPSKALQPLLRIPIVTSKNVADAAGVDVSGIDFSKKVCLSTLGSKMKQGGPFQKAMKAVGVTLGLVGSDFCFSLPGLDTTGKDLIFGLKMELTTFDKTTVDLTKIVDLMPKAWNTMTKDMTGGTGIKEIMTTALNSKPLASFAVLPADLKGASINSKIKEFMTTSWPAKSTVEIDVGKILQGVTALSAAMDGKNHFKLPNMFGARRRSLAEEEEDMKIEVPTTMKLRAGEINVGNNGLLRRLTGTMINHEATYVHADGSQESVDERRELAAGPDGTFKFKYKTYVLEGSQCDLYLQKMPKKLSCTLKLKLGKMDLTLQPEFELSYDLNGKDLVLIARAKAKLMVGTAADYASITGKDKLAKFDVGGLIDDSLSGTISLIPVGIEFPKKGLFEIARVKISTIKEQGVCLSKMKEIVPDAQKPQIIQIADIVNKVLGFFGGDICAKTPGLDLTDGFKIDVNGVLTLFDKTKINIYPIIDALKMVEPSLATVITAVQTVFGSAIKTAMNDAAKAVMPNQYDFTVNMGKLIADAKDAVSGATLPTRRLAEAKPGADGKFNLGGIKKSANPSSKDSGKPDEKSSIGGKTVDVKPDANGGDAAGGAGCKKAGGNGTSTTDLPGTMGGGLIFLIILLIIIILGGIIAAVIFKKKQESETTSPNFILAGIAVLWVSLLIVTIIIGVVGTDDMNAKNGGANATKCTTAATPAASNSTTSTDGQVGMGGGFIFLIIFFTCALIGLIVAAVLFKKKSDEAAADGEGGKGAPGGGKSKSVTNPVGSTANKKNSGGSVEVTVHAVTDENERGQSAQ